jgi:hypothetical protein
VEAETLWLRALGLKQGRKGNLRGENPKGDREEKGRQTERGNTGH